MTHEKKTTIIAFASCIFGVLFYAIQYEYIIIRSSLAVTKQQPNPTITSRVCTIIYHQNNRVCFETVRLEWPEQDKARTVFNLTSNFFDTLLHEGIIMYRISVQTVVHDPHTNTIYISLDRTPFENQWSIYKKWLLVEDLLATLYKNNIAFPYVQLLVNHQPLSDSHLDFSRAWPIQGFIR